MGVLGEVAQEILQLFQIKDNVFAAELDVERLLALVPKEKTFVPLPKFPPVDRDIAIVVNEDVLSEKVTEKIKMAGGDLIEELVLFDVYHGKQISAGKKSLAYSIRYRSQVRTLTDEEVDGIHQNVIRELEGTFGATLRR